jgi:hypothetical protein
MHSHFFRAKKNFEQNNFKKENYKWKNFESFNDGLTFKNNFDLQIYLQTRKLR